MITFNEIEADEIPFLRVEFDNSLNVDPFDVSLRVLLIAGSDPLVSLEKPTLVSSKDDAAKLGVGSRIESLVDSWYRSSSLPLHIFTHKAQMSMDEWKAVIQKIVDTDKLFDIVILQTVRRTAIKEAARIFAEATIKDGAIRPLVTTAFQITASDAISYMTDPVFVFPPTAVNSGTVVSGVTPAPTPSPAPAPKPGTNIGEVITNPTVEGITEEVQPAAATRIKRSKAEPEESPAEEEAMPRAALRAAGFDAATIPNLENLCILPIAPIKNSAGQSAGISDGLLSIKFAAELANAAQKNPARPFNGLPLRDVTPFRREDGYSRKELNDCVKNGLCACSVDGNGNIVLERVVTTRRQDSRGEPDYSLADANVNLIDNFLKKTFSNYFWNAYISQRALLVDDNAVVPASVDFPVIKPRTAKAEALNVFRIWQEKLIVQDEDAFLESLKVEREGKTLKFSFKARYIQGLLGIQAKIYRAR